MNIGLIGSGGREHALCKKIYLSNLVNQIFCFPGNAGTSQIAINVNVDILNFKKVLKLVRLYKIDLVIVGPEEPLVNGIVDFLRKNNIKVEEEDTRNAMMREIQKYPGQEKQVMDYFKNNPEAQQQLSGPIFEDKIIDFILELADVKEKTVSVEELYKSDELDLQKEAAKAKKSNKSVKSGKPKTTVKKNKAKS